MSDEAKESIDAARHLPSHDASRINRAVEKAANNPDFVNHAIAKLVGLKFPAFKHNIMDHVKNINSSSSKRRADEKEESDDDDVIALFESLNGYIQFRDVYHVQKAFEENIPEKKKEDLQISDETRENPEVRVRKTTADKGIKDREAVNEREEREDYPEVTPTAMSNFICERCGKFFQNQHDLINHQSFESGRSATSD